MITNFVRAVVAFGLGLITSFALIVGVEVISNLVHPFPSDFQGTSEEICMHVANYPDWILAGVVVAWGLTAAVGTWIAQRIGSVYSATALALLLTAGVAFNISMLPYAIWFKVAVIIAVPLASLVGAKYALSNSKSKAGVTAIAD